MKVQGAVEKWEPCPEAGVKVSIAAYSWDTVLLVMISLT